MTLRIFDSVENKIVNIETIEEDHIKLYVCGPTVYDRPHLGNARSIVIYDLFYRLFLVLFDKVTYVRNITDVDDKINDAAKSQNISINELTSKIIKIFDEDIAKLNVLKPSFEPRATDHIVEMINMIQKLIDQGFAYVSQGHVLFDVSSYEKYGNLSNRKLDEMIAGARVEVADYKRNPLDFVLWKPANSDDDKSSTFESPWHYNGNNLGRPGWHIECSAMSTKYLGENFDIHGGGADLRFPHHENEIAQSVCANKGSSYAKYWIHNGFLTVNGEKMSKSLNNFFTVKDLLDDDKKGVAIRFMLLASHYRKPLDFNEKAILDAKKTIDKFNNVVLKEDLAELNNHFSKINLDDLDDNSIIKKAILSLCDDLNMAKLIADLHEEVKNLTSDVADNRRKEFVFVLNLLGFIDFDKFLAKNDVDEEFINEKIAQRLQAKLDKNYQLADQIRNELKDKGIIIEDVSGGKTIWKSS